MAFITLHGMDEAIANLNLHPGTLKSLLTAIIRASFPTEESLREIVALPAEDIIRQLWNVDQPEEIRQKKKNLSSLKSAINKELKELTRQGKNPEGLIISRENVFTISDEQKNDILQKLGIGAGLDPQDLISVVRALLDGVLQQGGSRQENAASLLQELDRAREKLAQVAGAGTPATLSPAAPAVGVSSAGTRDAGLAATKNGQGGTQETGGGPGGQSVGKPAGEELSGDEKAEVIDQEQILADDAEIIVESPAMEEIEVIDQEQILDQDMELVEEALPLEEAEAVEQQSLVDDFEIIDQPLAAAEEGSGSHDYPAADTEIAAEAEFAGAAGADAAIDGAGAKQFDFPAPEQAIMPVADQGEEAGPQLPADEWLEEDITEEIDQEQILDQDTEIVEEALPLEEAEIVEQQQSLVDDLEIIDQPLAATDEGSGSQDFPAADTEIAVEGEFAGAAGADAAIDGAGAKQFDFPAPEQAIMPVADQGEEAGPQLPADDWLEEEITEEIDQEQILDQDTEIVEEALPLEEAEIVEQQQSLVDDLEIIDQPLAATDEGSGSHDFPAAKTEIAAEGEFAGAAGDDAGAKQFDFPAPEQAMPVADQGEETSPQRPADDWLEEEITEEIDQEQILDQDTEIMEETPPLEEAEIVEQQSLVDDLEIIDQPLAAAEDGSGSQDFPAADTEIAAEGEFAGAAGDGAGTKQFDFPAPEQAMPVADQGEETSPQRPADDWLEEEITEEIDQEQILAQDTEIVEEALPLEEAEVVEQQSLVDDLEIIDQPLAVADEGSDSQDFPAADTEIAAEGEFAGAAGDGAGAKQFDFPAAEQAMPVADQGEEAGSQLPGDEWLEEVETEEIDQEEILDQDTAMAEQAAMAGTGESHAPVDTLPDGRQESGRRLDLSHYIDADEAMAALPETLVETHDEYIAQILDRFMPKFIRIPAGYYLTGRDRPGHNERQAKKILLDNFYISQLPVTNDLFDFFVRETGYETDAERVGFGTVVTGRICNSIDPQTGRNILSISHGTRSQRMPGANWRHPQGPASSLENKANHPVVQVSRHDALAFAAWAGKRLPSEDEWEAAARGSFGFLFPWGNEWHGELANTESSLIGDTTPVTRHGKLSMSPFGVYDLLGNVFEWTATVAGLKRRTNSNAPPIYVLKGGCWTSGTGTTAASRLLESETWSNIIGFRCAV